jgi:hypothetical protein
LLVREVESLLPGRRAVRAVRRRGALAQVELECLLAAGLDDARPRAEACEPSIRARKRIPYPRRERGRPWSSYVTEWKARRRAQGLAVPNGPPPTAQRPDYSKDVGAALPGESRTKASWADPGELIAWAGRYLTQLQPRERASQRGYDQWAAGQAHRGRPPLAGDTPVGRRCAMPRADACEMMGTGSLTPHDAL